MKRLVILLYLALLAPTVVAQAGGTGEDPRQRMWPSPTAADWKRPVLIQWQRTWKDALAVSKATRRPILICVNMDGEIASEHYAGIRYRQKEIAALYKPYVCVIASVYRHNPRDYDDQGRRIPCPRFGGVTCGEHIAIEPLLYKKYFDGKRIAPRHIMIELDGSEQYDVYYAFDTKSVFDRIGKGIADRTIKPINLVRGDRSLVERVASRDVRDRLAVEQAFLKGDRKTRMTLLKAAAAHQEASPMGLLRLAVFGLDLEMSKVARNALTRSQQAGAIDLIAEALRMPMPAEERNSLIGALERFGAKDLRARTTAVVHRGLSTRSQTVKVDEWSKALSGARYQAAPQSDWNSLVARLEEKARLTGGDTKDPAKYLDLAEESLRYAINPTTRQSIAGDRRTGGKYSRMVFLDVLRPARRAEKLGAKGWRVDTAIALASYYLGDREEAYARAERAVKNLPPGAKGWNAMAVLSLFAVSRQEAITKAIKAKRNWPPSWLTDVHATYSVLLRHPHCTADQVVSHYDFLYSLSAFGQAWRVLGAGLKRFPESWKLHERYRNRILVTRGAGALEPAYRKLLDREKITPNLAWFAGYASLVAAECHKRAGRMARSRAAYTNAVALYDRNIKAHPESKANSDHYAALALAGRARLALEAKDYDRAAADILACFARHPQAAASLDGLGFTPVLTAKALLARLNELNRKDLAAKVDGALHRLEELDPRLLDPPAYETGGRPSGLGRTQGRRQGRRQGNRRQNNPGAPSQPRRTRL